MINKCTTKYKNSKTIQQLKEIIHLAQYVNDITLVKGTELSKKDPLFVQRSGWNNDIIYVHVLAIFHLLKNRLDFLILFIQQSDVLLHFVLHTQKYA